MFRKIFELQWAALKLPLLVFTIGSFALPLASVQGQLAVGSASGWDQAATILTTMAMWLPFFPGLAALVGITVALGSWTWDQQGKHVYAYSLPLTRQRYVLLKMLAGAALLAVPSAALWDGRSGRYGGGRHPFGTARLPHRGRRSLCHREPRDLRRRLRAGRMVRTTVAHGGLGAGSGSHPG